MTRGGTTTAAVGSVTDRGGSFKTHHIPSVLSLNSLFCLVNMRLMQMLRSAPNTLTETGGDVGGGTISGVSSSKKVFLGINENKYQINNYRKEPERLLACLS